MKKGLFSKILLSSLVGFSFFAVVTGTVAWFISGGLQADKQADGEVGLRSYFYSGDGLTESTAYEITTPTHMYNLSQLQNIGLFPEKRYFRIGHLDTNDNEYKVIVGYDASGDPIWGDILDMAGTEIAPIGNEATPFNSEFDGHGIPVKNAIVKGNPEDIGFFGYIGYEGDVSNLVLINPTIESLGYNSDPTNKQYKLFNPEIEQLYYESSLYFEKFTNVKFYGYDLGNYQRDVGTLLTKQNGLGGSSYGNINYDGNGNLIHVNKGTEVAPEEEFIYNGYFEIKFPKDFLDDPNVTMTQEERNHITNDVFTYHWVASSPLISEETCIDVTGDSQNDALPMINLTKLINSGTEERDFNQEDVNSTVKTRLYLYASIEYKNFEYSRVIQSYDVEFHSNKDSNAGYSMAIFCDYVAAESAEHPVTNYHHGNNIGFLAGHLDGNMTSCFVYGNDDSNTQHGGHLKMNNTSGLCPIATTSDIGLIGEVGEGVYNKMDPDMGVMINGDTGVMNFTKIYEGIRKDLVAGDVVKAGHITSPTANYISYSGIDQEGNSIINTSPTSLFHNYEEYLRYDTVNNEKKYFSGVKLNIPSVPASDLVDEGDEATTWHNYTITEKNLKDYPEINSVDFLWNRVIQDEEGKERGLGVFKIATVHDGNASNPNSDDMYRSLGGTSIINGTGHSKVYFSTAEYDHVKNATSGKPWPSNAPFRATTLPSYSDINSFDYNFERDYNYCFELDLSQVGDTNGYNFMSNTDSPWLANYLSSKLIDKKGEPVKPGSKRFGFMFRSSESVELNQLSSYMAVGYPKKNNKSAYGSSYYPSNSIVFKIDNENGANVSVVARRNDVTVYSHHSNVSSSSDITPLYTMRVQSASNDASIDAHRYFKFDVSKEVVEDGETVIKRGLTGTEAVPFEDDMVDDNNLYAHIFKLPMGEYVLGAAADGKSNDSTADIYFLAVQGQNEGDLGSDIVSEIGNVLDDVDFLTVEPTKATFANGLVKAQFQFVAQFNTLHGDFVVNTVNVNSTDYLSLEFEGPDDPRFVNSLSLISSSTSPRYYVRGEEFTKIYHTYR